MSGAQDQKNSPANAPAAFSAQTVLDAMTQIASQSNLGLWYWDLASSMIVFDATCESILGFGPGNAQDLMERWQKILHPDDRERAVSALYRHVEDANHTYDIEYRAIRDDGSISWIKSNGGAIHRDAQGKALNMLGFVEDITHRKTVEEVVTRQQELLQTIFDRIPVMIAYMEPNGKFGLVNKEWERTLGWRFEDLENINIFSELYPDLADRAQVARHIKGDPAGWAEYRTRIRDGTIIETSWANIPLSDGSTISIGQDITERKRRRERLHTLMREIDHRVKNNLTSMLAMCEQSIRVAESPEDFRRRFRSKIRAMASMHMALAKERWEGVRMEELVKLTLDPYIGDDRSRLIGIGPHVMLKSRMVTPLGLTLHELGTNAQKHGAWSVPGGSVKLRWSMPNDRTLHIVWEEIGGPITKPPTRQGQGTQLIAGFVEYELSGKYTPDYRPTGLHVDLMITMA